MLVCFHNAWSSIELQVEEYKLQFTTAFSLEFSLELILLRDGILYVYSGYIASVKAA